MPNPEVPVPPVFPYLPGDPTESDVTDLREFNQDYIDFVISLATAIDLQPYGRGQKVLHLDWDALAAASALAPDLIARQQDRAAWLMTIRDENMAEG